MSSRVILYNRVSCAISPALVIGIMSTASTAAKEVQGILGEEIGVKVQGRVHILAGRDVNTTDRIRVHLKWQYIRIGAQGESCHVSLLYSRTQGEVFDQAVRMDSMGN